MNWCLWKDGNCHFHFLVIRKEYMYIYINIYIMNVLFEGRIIVNVKIEGIGNCQHWTKIFLTN